jgi:hypothetical protein
MGPDLALLASARIVGAGKEEICSLAPLHIGPKVPNQVFQQPFL